MLCLWPRIHLRALPLALVLLTACMLAARPLAPDRGPCQAGPLALLLAWAPAPALPNCTHPPPRAVALGPSRMLPNCDVAPPPPPSPPSSAAGEMLAKLTLTYNRTRQASITTELIEIISGASQRPGDGREIVMNMNPPLVWYRLGLILMFLCPQVPPRWRTDHPPPLGLAVRRSRAGRPSTTTRLPTPVSAHTLFSCMRAWHRVPDPPFGCNPFFASQPKHSGAGTGALSWRLVCVWRGGGVIDP